MDLDTRIAAGYAADEERDKADQSRSDLERNSSLSSASRLDAIKDGININPDAKNNIMYRKITGHNVKFQGTLPSNKTKTFGLMDTLRSGWNYLTGQYRNAPNRVQEFINPEGMANKYYNSMRDYYKRTGDLDVGNYFQSVGIDPRTLSPMQRQMIDASIDALRSGTDLYGNPVTQYGVAGTQNYKNYRNISDAFLNKDAAPNAQRWMGNAMNNGLTDKNKQQLYRRMHDDYYGLSPYARQEQGITPEEMNEAQVDMRNQMLANQVNTYQNSLDQYNKHRKSYKELSQGLSGNNSIGSKIKGELNQMQMDLKGKNMDTSEVDALVNSLSNNPDAYLQAYEFLKKNKRLPNGVDKVDLIDTVSKLKGHRAMMNKANYDLRAQGLTGLTDNKDYDTTAGKRTKNVDGKDIEIGGKEFVIDTNGNRVAVDTMNQKSRFDEFRDDINARYQEQMKKTQDLQAQISTENKARTAIKQQLRKGVDANGKQLTPEAIQKLQEDLAKYDDPNSKLNQLKAQMEEMQNNGMYRRVKTMYDNLGFHLADDKRNTDYNTAQKQLADYKALQQQIQSGVGADGKQLTPEQIKELTDKVNKVDVNQLNDTINSYQSDLKKQQDIARDKFIDRSTANRRKNEVTDVNQFQAITGQNVDMMKDPDEQYKAAKKAYDDALNTAQTGYTPKYANSTDWYNSLSGKEKARLKLSTRDKSGKWVADQQKVDNYYNNNIAKFNKDAWNKGAGKDLLTAMNEAAKAKQGYDPNAVKTIQSDGNGGFAYGTQHQHQQAQDKRDKMAKQLYDMTGYEYGVPTNDRNYHPLSKPQSLFSDRTVESVNRFYSMTPAEKKNYAIKGGIAVGMGAAGVAIPYGYKKLTEDDDDDDGDDSFFSDRSRNSITRYYSNDELTRRNVYIDDEYTEPEEYYQGMGKPSYNTREDAKDEIIREASKYALGAGAVGLATYELYKHLFD